MAAVDVHALRASIRSGTAQLDVSPLLPHAIESIGWSGTRMDLDNVLAELERVAAGEVEYLTLRADGLPVVANGGIDFAKEPGAGVIWQLATHPQLQGLGLATGPTRQSNVASAGMTSIWVDCLGRNFGQGFDLLEAAVRDCSDELWERSMWPVPARDTDKELPGPDGTLVTDPAARRALVQRHSAPWSIAWHALEVLDYDLAGELLPWASPAPFTGRAHWRELTMLPSAWSRPEILGYIDHCRQRVRDTLSEMTDEKAATPLPPAHRYRGQPYAWIVTGLPGHTIEHASQIRQFVTAAGVVPGA